jgi:hypothetical protein
MSGSKIVDTPSPEEAIGELIGCPLPPDWRDLLAVQVRQDHLAALSHLAGDAAVELLLRQHAAVQRDERVTVGDPAISDFVNNLIELDRGWRTYTHQTQRGDAGKIVHESIEWSSGSLVAAFVEGSLERLRRDMQGIIEDVVQERGIDDGGGH